MVVVVAVQMVVVSVAVMVVFTVFSAGLCKCELSVISLSNN